MPVRSDIQLRGYFELVPSGSRSIAPADLVSLDAPHRVDQLDLDGGEGVTNIVTTLTPPLNATGLIITLKSAADLISLYLKGNVGDVGINLSVVAGTWNVITLVVAGYGGNDVILDASGTTTVECQIEVMWF